MKKFSVITLVCFLLGLSGWAQRNWYVSPSGDDNNPGTLDQPLKTVGAAANNAAAGDTIILRGGVYREKVELNKNNLTLRNYPGESPVIKGSVVMTGWEARGSFWKKYVDVQPQQVFVDGNHPLQQIGYPNEWFKNHTGYSVFNDPVGEGIEDMAAGRFWWESDTLYIWLEDSSDPNDHQIEVSQKDVILASANVQGTYIKGIIFEHSNGNTFGNQVSAIGLGSYCTMDSCIIQWCDWGGVSTGYRKTGAKILNCQVLYNGAVGITCAESMDFLIKNTRMAYNNYRNFYSQWHTGGFKGATYSYGTIENCEVDHNNGPGVWFDWCMHSGKYDENDGDNFYPIIVRNNYFHGNGTGNYDPNSINNNASILIEVSEQALVYNNIIDTFQYRGIWISGSYFTTVTGNLLAHGTGSFSLDGGAIYAATPPAYLKYNRIVNNILYDNATSYDLRMRPEDGSIVHHNICRNNLFYRSGGTVKMKYGGATISSLEDWKNKTPYGEQSQETDPLFLDGEFHLSDQSPCINMGYNILIDTMKMDYEGKARMAGLFIDVGPLEASVGADDAYNAALESLTVDMGALLPTFAYDHFVYYDTLPDNTTEIPVVTAMPVYSGASVMIRNATDVMSENEADRTTTVTVTSENGQIIYEYKVVFYSKNTTGISGIGNVSWKVYPNPVSSKLYIETTQNGAIPVITITDLSGRNFLCEQTPCSEGRVAVNTEDLPEGLYLIKVTGEKLTRTFRVMVTR